MSGDAWAYHADAGTLGPALRRLREGAGLTQSELAGRARIGVGTIRDLEQGRTARPRPANLAALADVFGIPVGQLPVRTAAVATISVLGPLRVVVDGRPIAITAAKQATILALLAVRANEHVGLEDIVSSAWSGSPPHEEAALVQTHVARLRKQLTARRGSAATIRSERDGYRLVAADDAVDVLTWRRLSRVARSVEAHLDALALWCGQALADVPALQSHPAVVMLRRDHADAVLRFADAALAARQPGLALPAVETLAEAEPLHEAVAARRIRLRAAAGRPDEAYEAFTETRRALVEALGVEPGEELTGAYRDVLDRAPLIINDRPRPKPAPVPAELPRDLTDFVGRETEAARIVEHLHSCTGTPLAVISGTGGIGKTSLAIHIGHAVKAGYPDGQLYVDLRGAGDEAGDDRRVLERLLVALGHERSSLPPDRDALIPLYRSTISAGRYLVVIDDACSAEQIMPLLPGSEGCAVIVTSRRRLTDLDGARHVHLPAMTTDQSATLLRSVVGAEIVEDGAEDVARIAELCGGLPLAVRLAAGQAAAHPGRPIRELRARLAATHSRLSTLRSPHRAVEACFELSYRQLPSAAQRLLRMISLSDGALLSEAACAHLAGEPIDTVAPALDRLVEYSMVNVTAGRFGLHDLMRTYARERSAELDTAASRQHAVGRLIAWYVSAARQATQRAIAHRVAPPAPEFDGAAAVLDFPSVESARDWLEAECDTIIVTIRQAAECGLHRLTWLLADAVTGAFRQRQLSREWLETAQIGLAAARACGDRHGEVMMLFSMARGYSTRGDHQRAAREYQRALHIAAELSWDEAQLSIIENLGDTHKDAGDLSAAVDALGHGLALSRRVGDRFWEAACLNDLGNVHLGRGDLRAAQRLYQEALHLNAELDRGQPNINLGNLGIVAFLRGEYHDSLRYLRAARELDERDGNPLELSETLANLSETALALGRLDDAARYARDGLELVQTIDDDGLLARTLAVSGRVQLAMGSPLVAAQQLERALAVARASRSRYAEVLVLLALAQHAEANGDTTADRALSEQAHRIAVDIGDRITEGVALVRIGRCAAALGDLPLAQASAARAHQLLGETGHRPGQSDATRLLDELPALIP